MEVGHIEIPSPVTVLGSKGCGESCTMSVPACLAGAIDDALKPLGATVKRLPLKPNDIWHLIQDANASMDRKTSP